MPIKYFTGSQTSNASISVTSHSYNKDIDLPEVSTCCTASFECLTIYPSQLATSLDLLECDVKITLPIIF